MTAPITIRMSLGETCFETGVLQPADVKGFISMWARYAKKRGLTREDAKSAVIGGLLNNQYQDFEGCTLLTSAALWLARVQVRQQTEACTLVHEITPLKSGAYQYTMGFAPPPRDRTLAELPPGGTVH